MTVVLWVILLDDGWGYGHVFATCGWRSWGVCNTPLHVLHAIHRNTVMLFEPDTYFGWEYGYVFRTGDMFRLGIRTCFRHLRVAFVGCMLLRPYTCYMSYIKIRPCFPNRVHVIHRNTNVFSEPDIRYPSKYGNVFRTGNIFLLGIRTCFPNRACVIHRDTETFSKRGTRYPPKCGRVFRIR